MLDLPFFLLICCFKKKENGLGETVQKQKMALVYPATPACWAMSPPWKIFLQMQSDYLHCNYIIAQIKNQYLFFTIWE